MKSKGKFLSGVSNVFAKYNLPLILVIVFCIFSLLLPKSFPTWFNIKSMLNNQSVIIMLTLAVLVTIATNNYNLSVGYQVGLMHILVVGLQVNQGLSWPLACLAVMAIGCFIGLINGLLVSRVGVSDFITTLGMGEVIYGISFLYTGGRQVVGDLPKAFMNIASNLGNVPTLILIVLVVAIVIFIVMEYLPFGRFLYFIGANKKAADLSGIDPKRYITYAYVISGFITSLAGIMLGAMMRVGQTSVGPDYLMSANAGALLGAVCFKVGKVNVWGSVCATLLLATVISGLQQMGAAYWVEPLFNGATLVLAVAVSLTAAKNRISKSKRLKDRSIRESRQGG
ncbi:ABC transporter permease [Qiania dongpingensis]|uniref:ABC transporter permease n=1 Tax=Qiania dongpingensis TaxID=2763669 RepID=A0A7G9G6S8_9FIRM|nr:ABC transporter permease [Qiania dongpingensis]QNM06510.1 ABC transporter permease [Qiania dongpingensis]